jgi:hypothetical protein
MTSSASRPNHRPFNKVRVFSATMAHDRDNLGEKIAITFFYHEPV